ncbi:MAG: DUF2889 domain-containing protein [Desulfuromonadaceae bacterium]|nr:DUF2889 domain-containing protein [Desulfuromonadaceae bacterium]
MRQTNVLDSFHRDISYHVSMAGNDSISLLGTLRDRYHDIEIEVLVDSASLKIVDIRSSFRSVPSPFCHDVEKRLQTLKGMQIAKGINRRVGEVLGGPAGCGNLRSLLMGLLPLAINTRAAAGLDDESRMLEAMHEQMKGTCAGFPENP